MFGVCVFVISLFVCVLACISICIFCMFCSCMTVHDHINIVHACTCVLMYVYVHVCVGCLIPHQLPLLDPSGLFAFLSDWARARIGEERKHSRDSLCLLSYPFLLNEEDQKLLTHETGLQQIKLISFHVTTVYMTVKPKEQKALWLKKL